MASARASSDSWSSGCGSGAPHAVGTHGSDKSTAGAFDLGGNVREWTASDYAPYPGGTASSDRRGRVTRGGSYLMDARELGASFTRNVDRPDTARADLGFRCAVSLPAGEGQKR